MSEVPANLSFRAQSLDNIEPDPMEVNRHILKPAEQEKRQWLVHRISQVSISGRRVFSRDHISAFRFHDEFVLEVPSDTQDLAHRVAPIICYGHVAEFPEELWPDQVVMALGEFAQRIGRGVSDQDVLSALDGLKVIAERKSPNVNLLRRVLERILTSCRKIWESVSELSERIFVEKGEIDDSLKQLVAAPPNSTKLTREKTMASPFLRDTQNRKGIVVLSRAEIDRCRYDVGGDDLLLNGEIYVLEFPVRDPQKVIQDQIDRGLVRRGAVLIQSPFNQDRYEDAAQANQVFALEKNSHFTTFCKHLGAREVRIEEIRFRSASKNVSASVEGDGKTPKGPISAHTSSSQDELNTFRSQLKSVSTFEGGPANLEAANEFLRRTNLVRDDTMAGLLEMCRSASNRPKSQSWMLSLSTESNQRLKVIGKLKFPSFIKLEVDCKKIVRENSDYSLSVEVRF